MNSATTWNPDAVSATQKGPRRSPPPAIAAGLREHEAFLWSLLYRLTGCAADADDLVQETFLRAIERPPARVDEPLRPWLVRVALNLGKDALRRRKRRAYTGSWLPSPIETEEPPSWEISGEDGTEGRYDLLESASFAFLLALEALTPQQRAVILLRDVFEYSVEETASALGISVPNVKTTHHRARRALAAYEGARARPSPARSARTAEAIMRFLEGLARNDIAATLAVLAPDAVAIGDGGGEFFASKRPIRGAARIAKLYLGLTRNASRPTASTLRMLNGSPALLIERDEERRGWARRYVMCFDVDDQGQIRAIYSVLARRKLSAISPLTGAAPAERSLL